MNDGYEDLRFDLMEAVYNWARGMPFAEIMQLTEAQEGLIVRCIQRLGEVRRAARSQGENRKARKELLARVSWRRACFRFASTPVHIAVVISEK